MRKPKKPTIKEKKVIVIDDILADWDGLDVKDIITILLKVQVEYESAQFITDWKYDATDAIIEATESDDSFDERVEKYNVDIAEWKRYRIKVLQDELKEINCNEVDDV